MAQNEKYTKFVGVELKGKKTKTGRQKYMDEKGQTVSEKSLTFKLGNLSVKPNPNKSTAQVSFWVASNGKRRRNSKIELSKPCSNKIGVLPWPLDKKVVLIGREIKGVEIDWEWIF